MEILDLGSEGEESPRKQKGNKKLKAAVGIGGLAAVTGIGSTFAANISLNNDQAVEFGQGVTQTVACDEDGFTINPVTRYNNSLSKFVIDYVEITGINLTPRGTGAATPEDAAAHPGQYYDSGSSTWKNTCDGVVLDFKAYTDNDDYAAYAVGGNKANPLYWSQKDALKAGVAGSELKNSSFAVWINTTDSQSSYGSDSSTSNKYRLWLQIHANNANSSFKLRSNYNDHAPFAGAINKFTVESMPAFPSSYDVFDSGNYYWDTY